MTATRPGPTIVVAGHEIQVVERITMHAERVPGGILGRVALEPVAVIIRSDTGSRRVELDDPPRGTPGEHDQA